MSTNPEPTTPLFYTFKHYLPEDHVQKASQLLKEAADAIKSYQKLKKNLQYSSVSKNSLLGKRSSVFPPVTESEPSKMSQEKEKKSIEVEDQEGIVKEAIDKFMDFVYNKSNQINPVIWDQSEDKLLLSVEQIVYPRLASAVGGGLDPKSEFDFSFACQLIDSYSNFINSNCQEDDIAIIELLNLSRSLIDSKQACTDCSDILVPSRYSFGELDLEQMNIFDEAKQIYLERLKTPLAKYAINNVLNSFEENDDQKRQKILSSFEELVDCLVLVKRLPKAYAGMVGIKQVYIDTRNFFDIQDRNCLIARLVGIFFHEGMHFAQRVAQEDAAYLTPPSKSSATLYFEGGYCLEHSLYGSCDIKYWGLENAQKVLDIVRWNSESPIFTKEELKANTEKRIIKNPLCSGLCDVSDNTLEM